MFQHNPYWLIVLASLVALVPFFIGLMTSYIKVSIILGFLKNGLGAQNVPGNIVVMALSLALTLFIMQPVISETVKASEQIDPKLFNSSPDFSRLKSLAPLIHPWLEFMKTQAGKKELEVLSELHTRRMPQPLAEEGDPGLKVVMPAFVLSEIKSGFLMGFMVLLPFLVIDLVIANVLAGMGLYMLSPVIVSLPLKLMLFVLADGWLLLTKSIIQSY